MTKSKPKSQSWKRGKSAAPRQPKPDHYDAATIAEFYARNPWMDCAEGVSFDEGEKVNYDPKTGLVVKVGMPGSVPLGETCLPAPAEKGKNVIVPIFTCEEFYRDFTLTGKEHPQC